MLNSTAKNIYGFKTSVIVSASAIVAVAPGGVVNILVLAALTDATGNAVTARRIAATLAPSHEVTIVDRMALGGNWNLERDVGLVQTNTIFSLASEESWQYLLAKLDWDTVNWTSGSLSRATPSAAARSVSH